MAKAGIGDDGAVIDHFGRQTVISTDLLVEGIHFDLMYTPLKHLGYKAVIVNISDIYAMNATPTQILLSIAISNKFSVEALDEFYEGVYFACEKYNVDLVGGDTTTSQRGFVISITAIGEVVIEYFAEHKIVPTSMMDISDGLSSEMLHICKQSNVGCVLYEDKLPLNEDSKEFAYKLELDPTACALSGGEDYELLFTVSQADHEKVTQNNGLSIIGYITEASEGKTFITRGGKKYDLIAQGWNHLK